MGASLTRGLEVVRRRGLIPTVKLAAQQYAPGSRWEDEYLWYELRLDRDDLPRRDLAGGLELRRGTAEDMVLLAQLPRDPEITAITPGLLRQRLSEGALLWVVVENGRTAFGCWNFFGRAPLAGARGGTMALPEGVVLLEDSISSPDFRGRGVAPAAWAGIAAALRERGCRAMVTKVRSDNAAVRSALEKVGFEAVATMRRMRKRGRMTMTIELAGDDARGTWLQQLER